MPRKRRVWWPGATYHIMNRGNRRQDIFLDDQDFRIYLSFLTQVKEKHPFKLHAYCLMSNHVHFQLETIDKDPGTIMKLINMKYAIFFNKKYDFVGHLMQGRFRAEIIQDDRYFLAVNRYIHLNPVKAGIVLHPKNYRWSSYKDYQKGIRPSLADVDKVLGCFPTPKINGFEEFTIGGRPEHNTSEFTLPKLLELDD